MSKTERTFRRGRSATPVAGWAVLLGAALAFVLAPAALAQPDREPAWSETDGHAETVGDPIKVDRDPFPPQGSIVGWGSRVVGVDLGEGFVALAASWDYCLGLKADGSIVAWGRNDYGQCDVPAPNTGFVALAGGEWHSLGLKADGSIVAWGGNYYGQCDVPAPNTGFVALAAGRSHSLGRKDDGSIVAWGDNYYGQCDVPAPNTGFVAVAGGYYHSAGLKTTAPSWRGVATTTASATCPRQTPASSPSRGANSTAWA